MIQQRMKTKGIVEIVDPNRKCWGVLKTCFWPIH